METGMGLRVKAMRAGPPGRGLLLALGLALVLGPAGKSGATAAPAAPVVPVGVDAYALVEAAPVREGFAIFNLEVANLQPVPRAADLLGPGDDPRLYALRRSVERMLRREGIARDWSRSNRAGLNFADEIARVVGADGLAYAVESELVVHGDRLVPLGLRLGGGPGHRVRYAIGLIVADQVVLTESGELGGAEPQAQWLVRLQPSGRDAAVPVRAVFAVQGEGETLEERRQAVAAVTAGMIASSDGRLAVAERAEEAAQWLVPLPAFLKPEQVGAPDGQKEHKPAKSKKKQKKKAGDQETPH